MRYVVMAGAACVLVAATGGRAEANLRLNLVVRSCDATNQPWKTSDQDGRLGRLTMKDQLGEVVQTQESVHFSASRCQATFTMSFSDANLLRFLDPDDPMFLTLEGCSLSSTTCTFATGVLDSKPIVFQGSPLDSLLPDVFALQAEAIMAEMNARIAGDQALTTALAAEAARATGAEQALAEALAAEVARANAAEQALGDGLAAEILRATAAELAEEQARIEAVAAEREAREDAIADEAQARAEAIEAEALARLQAIADEAGLRAAADDAMRAYADETFVPAAGGTITGELTVDGVLRLRGGLSWDACPDGLDALEHSFDAVQGTSNRLCASAFQSTAPSVRIDALLGSYIEPICPMVVAVVRNYTEIGGPAAIDAVNTLLTQVTTLLNDQITPFGNQLIGKTTEVTNELIGRINGSIHEINALVAAHTAGVNDLIAAYNGLVADVNTALASATGGVNDSITAINDYLTGVRNQIDGVVTGINAAVGDVNTAFASIDAALGSTSDALNAFDASPTGINDALATLTGSLNARIGDINGLLASVNNARASLADAVNTALDNTDGRIDSIRLWLNDLANQINYQVTQPMNAAFETTLQKSIDGANYVRSEIIYGVNDVVVGPQNYTAFRGLNGIMAWIEVYITDPLLLPAPPWVPGIPSNLGQLNSLGNIGDIGINWQLNAPFVTVGDVSAPTALDDVDTVAAPSIGSLGLPHFDLGVSASMRTVSHGLAAPALAGVQAPSISGAGLDPLTPAAIPDIPAVEIPTIPAFEGFALVDAIDFDAVSALIGETMDPICEDVEATASSYLTAFVGDVPALVPDYADAEEVCGSLGAHVCGETEIAILAGDDGTPEDVGYGMGDWTGEGTVMFNRGAVRGFMMSVAWPFLHPDASKLMTFPPGFPFTFTPPVLPTGRFRCCASSAAFQ